MYCKNCNSDLSDLSTYCDQCGGRVIKNRLTFKNLSKSFSEEFFSYDNRFLKTLKELFTKPEAVIGGYINGTRKKHVGVVQYFAISLTLAGIQLFLTTVFFSEAMGTDVEMINDFSKNMESSKGQAFIKSYTDSMAFVQNYQNLIYIFSVPLGALSSWLAYYITSNRRYNLTEHIVINMYYSAQLLISLFVVSLIFLAFGLNLLLLYWIVVLISMGYYFYIFKRMYGMSFWPTFANMIVVFLIYSIWFAILFGVTILILILRN